MILIEIKILLPVAVFIESDGSAAGEAIGDTIGNDVDAVFTPLTIRQAFHLVVAGGVAHRLPIGLFHDADRGGVERFYSDGHTGHGCPVGQSHIAVDHTRGLAEAFALDGAHIGALALVYTLHAIDIGVLGLHRLVFVVQRAEIAGYGVPLLLLIKFVLAQHAEEIVGAARGRPCQFHAALLGLRIEGTDGVGVQEAVIGEVAKILFLDCHQQGVGIGAHDFQW